MCRICALIPLAYLAAMPRGIGRYIRTLVEKLHSLVTKEDLELYPEVAAALHALESAVEAHFPKNGRSAPAGEARSRDRRQQSAQKRIRALRWKLQYARKCRREAAAKIAAFTKGKDQEKKNAISPEFVARVALSWPATCARSFADAWRDLVGVGGSGCSRWTINSIRDGFVEVLQEMRGEECKLAIRSAAFAPVSPASAPASAAAAPVPASAASAPGLMCVPILHIQDEASLRLRSSGDTYTKAASRSRSSKVQQHVVHIFAQGQQPVRWLADLHPLADKTAKVLATSLHRILREVAEPVCTALGSLHLSHRAWVVHWLVGDGIRTNLAAAKILLAWVKAQPLPHRVRYFLLVVKCANHQANLAITSVVTGRVAIAGCRLESHSGKSLGDRPLTLPSKSAPSEVCGASVRLFKYLISDHYEVYLGNLHDIVSGKLRAVAASPEREQQCQRWKGMQRLYGTSVLPDGLLACLNGDITQWTHCSTSAAAAPGSAAGAPGAGSAAAAPDDPLAAVKQNLFEILRQRILVVDEQPTLTRCLPSLDTSIAYCCSSSSTSAQICSRPDSAANPLPGPRRGLRRCLPSSLQATLRNT